MHRMLTPGRLLLCAGIVVLGACGGDDNGPGDRNLSSFITSVALNYEAVPVAPPVYHPGRPPKAARPTFSALRDLVEGDYHEGDKPSTTGAGAATVEENSTALEGQPFKLNVSAAGTFTTAYIWIEGVDGYYEVTAPTAISTGQLILGISDNPPGDDFDLVTAVGTGGAVSASASTNVEPRDLTDADIAATVSWTGASDVDIHVIDPNGYEVSYLNTESPEGGRLDLDSNAGCSIDNVNTETISWPRGDAPAGNYTVVIEYYDDCGVGSSTYSVVVRRRGESAVNVGPSTFVGDYTENAPDTVGTYAVD